MFKLVSTLASATVLAVSLAAPAFAQDSSSTTSTHAAMQHSDSTGHESAMAHGATGHDSMARGTTSSETGTKHSDSMHHNNVARGESSGAAMKHGHATPHDRMTHDPKTSSP